MSELQPADPTLFDESKRLPQLAATIEMAPEITAASQAQPHERQALEQVPAKHFETQPIKQKVGRRLGSFIRGSVSVQSRILQQKDAAKTEFGQSYSKVSRRRQAFVTSMQDSDEVLARIESTVEGDAIFDRHDAERKPPEQQSNARITETKSINVPGHKNRPGKQRVISRTAHVAADGSITIKQMRVGTTYDTVGGQLREWSTRTPGQELVTKRIYDSMRSRTRKALLSRGEGDDGKVSAADIGIIQAKTESAKRQQKSTAK